MTSKGATDMTKLMCGLTGILTLALLVALLGAGCGGLPTEGNLTASESALVQDSTETDGLDGDVESGLEEPISGANDADPGAPPLELAADLTKFLGTVRTNPGLFFKPSGCIVSTVNANVVTHVFTGCTGPYGLVSYNGTVTSTWSYAAGKLSVTHVAKGFKINGATIDHTVTIAYTKSGALITRHRVGDSKGLTLTGRVISHHADYTTTYDTAAKCITRDGSSVTSIGKAELTRTISDYKRCGIGSQGCPMSGTVTITRKLLGLTLVVEFPGGPEMLVSTPQGKGEITLPLDCK
jgi:hypothetical protein